MARKHQCLCGMEPTPEAALLVAAGAKMRQQDTAQLGEGAEDTATEATAKAVGLVFAEVPALGRAGNLAAKARHAEAWRR